VNKQEAEENKPSVPHKANLLNCLGVFFFNQVKVKERQEKW
jgi:hypothetical protein